jgi:hypothetical protein
MLEVREAERALPTRKCDVAIAGGGTAGVVAAVAAARLGARTVLVESKGYLGGIAVEGGTALHSFYNLWKAFPGVEKKQVVGGIPQEIVDRLIAAGGCSGHAEMTKGYDYDSVCTAIDVEIYKQVAFAMCEEAGVELNPNTLCVGASADGTQATALIAESRSGREALMASQFVDCTGYGDLAAHAGAKFTEPNDYPVANSIGVGGVSVEGYKEFMEQHDALTQLSLGPRDGVDGRIVRIDGAGRKLGAFGEEAGKIGMSCVTSTVHDDYFMFIKLNYKMDVSPTDRDAAAKAEVELRRRQARAVELFREHVPGCEKAFIARSSPSLCIRRGRLIECDYDITSRDVLDAVRFDDELYVYGFHDFAPRLQITGGGVYGIPYRSVRPVGLDNLLVAGMLVTSDHEAHMSTRNTVSCMAMGQGVGTAAALCAAKGCTTRALPYEELRGALEGAGVIFG